MIARDVSARRRSLQLASRLQSLTTALSREITRERAVEVLLEHAVAALGADAGAVGLLTRSGTEIELAGSVGYVFEGDRDWSRFPLDADLPMSQSRPQRGGRLEHLG